MLVITNSSPVGQKHTNQIPPIGALTSPLLCRKDAARYLGIATQSLAQWAVSRRYDLPYISIGRKAMYRKTDLDAFIEANVQGGNQDRVQEASRG